MENGWEYIFGVGVRRQNRVSGISWSGYCCAEAHGWPKMIIDILSCLSTLGDKLACMLRSSYTRNAKLKRY
jgi:hypothetical protein